MIDFPSATKAFASPRETSNEIAHAILTLDSERDSVDIWTAPTQSEADAVLAEAWRLAELGVDELHWGCERFVRP